MERKYVDPYERAMNAYVVRPLSFKALLWGIPKMESVIERDRLVEEVDKSLRSDNINIHEYELLMDLIYNYYI